MKKRFSFATVSILIIVALFLGMQINSVISGDNIFEQLNKFKDVLSLTEKYYVDDVDTQKLVEAAINGMLSNLDPHSVYIPASQLQKVTEDFQGSFEGIGVEYDVINDTLIVVSPVSGGPSEALGILAGDKILKLGVKDYREPSVAVSLYGYKYACFTFQVPIRRPSTVRFAD